MAEKIEFDLIAHDKSRTASESFASNLAKIDRQVESTNRRLAKLRAESDKMRKAMDGASADIDSKHIPSINRYRAEWHKVGGAFRDFERDGMRVRVLATGIGTALGGMASNVAKDMGRLGTAVGGALADAAGPIAIGVGIGLTPVVLAAVNAAILGGVSAAAVGGGIALAAQDQEVKDAAAHLGQTVMEEMGRDAAPFVGKTVQAIGKVEKAWKDIEPNVARIMTAASRFVDPLVDGVTAMIKNMMPGLTEAIENSGPAIKQLAEGLGTIGHGLSSFFDSISRNGEETALALRMVMNTVGGTIALVGETLELGGKALHYMVEGIDKLASASQFLAGGLPIIGDWADKWKEITSGGKDNLEEHVSTMRRIGGAAEEAADGTGELTQTTEDLQEVVDAAEKSLKQLHNQFKLINSGGLDAVDAEYAFQGALDSVKDSIREHGKTLNKDTEDGRANQTQLSSLITAAQDRAEAIYAMSEQVNGSAQAERDAASSYAQGREKLIAMIISMGKGKEEAKALAEMLMRMPDSFGTDVKVSVTGADRLAAVLSTMRSIAAASKNSKGKYDVGTSMSSSYYELYARKGMSKGGPVTGRGPKGVDTELRMLAVGEYVLNDQAVDRLGGIEAVSRVNSGAPLPASGSSGGSSSTGNSGGGDTYVINVYALEPTEATGRAIVNAVQLARGRGFRPPRGWATA